METGKIGAERSWSSHLSAIESEGISVQAYAQREGLSAASLYYWRKRLKAQAGALGDGAVAQLVAVQLPEQAAIGQRCTMWLAPCVKLELSALPPAQWLAQVAGAVSQQAR